jgi:hypothetical protein
MDKKLERLVGFLGMDSELSCFHGDDFETDFRKALIGVLDKYDVVGKSPTIKEMKLSQVFAGGEEAGKRYMPVRNYSPILCNGAVPFGFWFVSASNIRPHVDNFRRYYGLNGNMPLTFSDIADNEGVSNAQVAKRIHFMHSLLIQKNKQDIWYGVLDATSVDSN